MLRNFALLDKINLNASSSSLAGSLSGKKSNSDKIKYYDKGTIFLIIGLIEGKLFSNSMLLSGDHKPIITNNSINQFDASLILSIFI